MARGKKKEKELTLEEKLQQALVPVDEQPYEVPENWCWVHLEALKEAQDGFFDGDWILSENMDSEGEVRLLQLSDIGIGEFLDKSNKHISERTYNLLGCTPLREGDVMISRMAEPIARSCIVPSFPYVVITAVDVAVLRCNPLLIFNYYINYLCNAKWFTELAFSLARGTTRVRITRKNLGEMPVPLPPISEQKRIVDRIESLFAKLDEAKEKAQAVVDGYEDRKAAILHKAFTGELTEGWRKKKNISFTTWKSVIMQDVCEKITCGKTPKEYISDKGEIPYLKVYNIVNDEIDFERIPQFIPREIHEGKLSSSILKPKDVIMNIVGPPLRKIAIIPDSYKEWNMNQAIVRFRAKEGLYYRYLYFALINPETLDKVINATRGVVGQANISVSQSRNLNITLPTIEEQKEIVRVLDIILMHEMQAKEAAEHVIDQIDSLKKAVLARAFRGELGTNDPTDESAEELLKQIIK